MCIYACIVNQHVYKGPSPSWHSLPSSFWLSGLKERGRMGVREEEEGEREVERGRMGMRKNKEREDGD